MCGLKFTNLLVFLYQVSVREFKVIRSHDSNLYVVKALKCKVLIGSNIQSLKMVRFATKLHRKESKRFTKIPFILYLIIISFFSILSDN